MQLYSCVDFVVFVGGHQRFLAQVGLGKTRGWEGRGV